jgi:hypothetical protein
MAPLPGAVPRWIRAGTRVNSKRSKGVHLAWGDTTRERLLKAHSAMDWAALSAGLPMPIPISPPREFACGLGFVMWVRWFDDQGARWLSLRVRSWRAEVVLCLKETRGPFTVSTAELEIESPRAAALHDAWLWFHGLIELPAIRLAGEIRRSENG